MYSQLSNVLKHEVNSFSCLFSIIFTCQISLLKNINELFVVTPLTNRSVDNRIFSVDDKFCIFISGDVLIKTCTGDRHKHLTVALDHVGAKNCAVVEKRLMQSYIAL